MEHDIITECIITGSITDVGKCRNIIISVVIQTGGSDGEDVTGNYNLKYIDGALEVCRADSEISITECNDKEYDGTTVIQEYTYTGDGEVEFIYMDEHMNILD